MATTVEEPPNIARHLRLMAMRQPHRHAVVVPEGRSPGGRPRYAHMTYRQLDAEADAIAHGLAVAGVVRGSRAAVMVRPGLDFFALTFAAFRAGVTPILIDPGMGLKSLGRCMDEAEPEFFFGVPKAVAVRRALGWGRETIREVFVVAPRWRWTGHRTLDEIRRLGKQRMAHRRADEPVPAPEADPHAPAAILFTSGSTGPPKGAVYTHSIFEAQVEMFRRAYEIEPGEIDLCTFPLFALFAPALGMTAIVPEMDFTRPARVDPDRLLETIDDFGPTNLFGSPALLRRVGPAAAGRGVRLTTLKRAITAGAPASPRVLEVFEALLSPPAEVFTPYGATEAMPVASIGSREILGTTRVLTEKGEGICVGKPFPGIDVRIIRITDEPIPTWSEDLELPDGEPGEIAVAGPIATREYFRRPDATRLAKIADPTRNSFFHRMGDIGYRDGSGRLWFCGRKSQRVVTADTTLFTICCEGVFGAHPDVTRAALVGVRRRALTVPVMCVEPASPLDRPGRDRLRGELLEMGSRFAHTRGIRDIVFHPSFPVDIRHNSKINREMLAAWAARKVR
ncbi:Long-chain-fatty-acid--CoA ligase [Aquisphaera giovannonii]|uniref:Long-chain-fatty-acid--CoA ligase n=1 Tax=Aquisphaera giovannonii TaxID=406548 RepID=A0A5B9WAG8_9BACT|nr:fatty acid CoA ligase family protein [Aquisphaera giovannonii]QEH37095.1 Long-chain-fatty-acid--CoA ligase [Aquisphaera giovannonii]